MTDPVSPPGVSAGTDPTPAPTSSRPHPAAILPHLRPIFDLHEGGKISVELKQPIRDRDDLSKVYTPGVAEVCEHLVSNPADKARYTAATRTIAVISDGTAVLGLGNIGPSASLPVMEGKACLFKQFGGLDAFPIVLDTTDTDRIVDAVIAMAPSFGGINLEDIAAPRCFEIERRVIAALDIPVMHDDQHGTAIVVTAALRNARIVTGRADGDLRVVIAGAGAAGVACAKMLHAAGVSDIIVTDSRGAIHSGRTDLHSSKQELLAFTNSGNVSGTTEEVLAGTDCFIGLSGGTIDPESIATMNPEPIVFALSNPNPEIDPRAAARRAAVVATGRSDFPNQINNVLAFPGVFRGALDVGATAITEPMKIAAALAIADVVRDELAADRIVPDPFDPRVVPAVTSAVAAAWTAGAGRS
ncbi:NAD(P)-dependent malic enzyme [Nakamurella lactea]|uniref:NAD(P)-dependent malic enzyme n=1 Tax=Nakamurella lactea TaxID=459515 RepID=UPI000401BA32|nr:NADP-dependent malic enzyme [Nakamurella lactea]